MERCRRHAETRHPCDKAAPHRGADQPLRVDDTLLRPRGETQRRLHAAETSGRSARPATHRPPLRSHALRLQRTVENRHPRLHEPKLHVRVHHQGTGPLHGAQPCHLQTRFPEGQRADARKMAHPETSGSGLRENSKREEESNGHLCRSRLQKPFPFLHRLQKAIRHTAGCRPDLTVPLLFSACKQAENRCGPHTRKERKLQKRLIMNPMICIPYWQDIQDRFIENKDNIPQRSDLEWIYGFDFNKINNTIPKKILLLAAKCRKIASKIKLYILR